VELWGNLLLFDAKKRFFCVFIQPSQNQYKTLFVNPLRLKNRPIGEKHQSIFLKKAFIFVLKMNAE